MHNGCGFLSKDASADNSCSRPSPNLAMLAAYGPSVGPISGGRIVRRSAEWPDNSKHRDVVCVVLLGKSKEPRGILEQVSGLATSGLGSCSGRRSARDVLVEKQQKDRLNHMNRLNASGTYRGFVREVSVS
ncbi:hypothetical protein CSOJ01_08207 [Colletotrichum sojae]|uniref:Uncharacterized protein n=1 Tax=Colletotrichum sojae TaxID=2175907 RepID=A0A8H6J7A0_9PEZI|nr:hypothetical protein CSOJ01_08207 [Colletotrichum sojae]